MPRALPAALFVTYACASTVPIATFDGVKATTLDWQTVNDPVMGGQSKSTFKVDADRKLGVWNGEVKIVPFLKAPGFCNLQSPAMGKTANFPSLTGVDGVTVRAREANASGLSHFNVQIMSKGAKRLFKQGVYMANVTLTNEMADHFLPWSAFKCSWRGESVSWCPELSTQLDKINSIGLGSAFPGAAGKFDVEMQSLSGTSKTLVADATYLNLATFDGKAPHKWHAENDPVMGGKSSSSVQETQSYADYKGTTRVVPGLGAPGFTIAMTEGFPFLSKFPDASSMDGITVSLRQVDSNFTGYKIAFCDSHINFYRCQLSSFKADLPVPASGNGEFTDVFVPWSKFSDKWSSTTGKHTAENPPKADNLKSITQLQIWTEAVEGDFHLQFQYIRASKAPGAFTQFIV
jgi:hypothetical protein